MKRFLLGCTAVALLIGAGLHLGGRLQPPWIQAGARAESRQGETAPQRPPVEVTVYTVENREVVFTRTLSGRTSAFQVAEIRPQVSGIILKRLFTEGSLVEKGRQLYQIDPATYQAACDSLAASLAKAMADLEAVEPKVERYARLVQMGGVSRQQYDDAVALLAQARAGVAMARADLAAARINLEYTKVLAPISGRIGMSSVTEGALVTASQATALATIQNLDQIYVDVRQSSGDLMELRRHMKDEGQNSMASLFIEKGTTPYACQGKILFSDVTVDPGTDMVRLRILFPNPENDLLPGLFVRARVEESRQEAAITVPQQSVVRNADGSVSVWTVDGEGVVQLRGITVSEVVGDRWLVTSGLSSGDRVVVEGLQKIRAQEKVTAVEMTSAKS
jgi:membrane fusion protein (multidrug efflux system)